MEIVSSTAGVAKIEFRDKEEVHKFIGDLNDLYNIFDKNIPERSQFIIRLSREIVN